MKTAYIAGRYRAKTEWELIGNIRLAEAYALKYAQLGYAVVCPHKNSSHMGGTLPDDYWLEATLELMRRCDVVVFIPGWVESVGARGEHAEALALGKEIVYDDAMSLSIDLTHGIRLPVTTKPRKPATPRPPQQSQHPAMPRMPRMPMTKRPK